MRDRFFASMFSGLIATMIAMSLGLPFWHHWTIGDACDFGIATFFLTWFSLKIAQGRVA